MKTLRPLIGIIPDYKEGAAGSYSTRDYYALRVNHVKAINKAGGAAVILTYDYELIDSYLESLDGILFVGGYFDIHPKEYGATEIHPEVKFNEPRAEFEKALAKKALQTKLPFLGICNGMQLLNVLQGGSAIQHIPDEGKFMDHEQGHEKDFNGYEKGYHEVEVVKNSKLFEICGSEKITTNSSHHQAARTVGAGLKISGRASDGIIEAIEKTDHPFCLGVQWHPEFEVSDADTKIFTEFVKAAEKFKKLNN